MNAKTRQPPHGRLADLSPFDIMVMVETSKVAACKQAAPWTQGSTDKFESEAQFGCVDWYQYHRETAETRGAK